MQELVYDIHVVCGCLKDFLRNLKEPLIPTSLWMLFVDAAKLKDNTMRYQSTKGAVKQLPAVNKDCISFLILHLQRSVSPLHFVSRFPFLLPPLLCLPARSLSLSSFHLYPSALRHQRTHMFGVCHALICWLF